MDTGVRFGWREAFPPTDAGAFELENEVKKASTDEDADWDWVAVAEPGKKLIKCTEKYYKISQRTTT